MNIDDIQSALNRLWDDCSLGFATLFWGIILLFSLPFGGWISAIICFFFWVGSAWLAVVGCFVVPLVDKLLPGWLVDLLSPGLIFIFLFIFAIVPPFLFVYYTLLLFNT
jgi:hypothetical protein